MSQSRFAAVAGASWLALIAATSLGAQDFDCVQTHVRAAPEFALASGDRYRLVVQAYAAGSLDAHERPTAEARPLGAAQREFSPEELRTGVDVDLVQLGAGVERDDAIVVAWIERGQADLDYDGLEARPGAHALWASGERVASGPVRLVLRSDASN